MASDSLNGIQPTAWGPPLWFFLHSVSINFPVNPTVEQRMQYYSFFKSLGYVLPCKECRQAYQDWTRDLDLGVFQSRKTLSLWVYNLHNKVNHKLKRFSGIPTYADVMQYYEMFRGGDSNPFKYKTVLAVQKSQKNA